MKYRLVGAERFLKLAKPGTLFIPVEVRTWGKERKESEITLITTQFKKDPQLLYDKNWSNLHVFVDNEGSVTFFYSIEFCTEEDDYVYYYDYNVVGDADPEYTLYLIVDSIEDIPDHIDFYCHSDRISKESFDRDVVLRDNETRLYSHYLRLTREEIKERYNVVLNRECKEAVEYNNDWAKDVLSEMDNPNLEIDIEVER